MIDIPPDPRVPTWRWSNLAEVILDESGWIPKPLDPTAEQLDSRHRHAGIGEYEEIIIGTLNRLGRSDDIAEFRSLVRIYRRDVKRVVRAWRQTGLL